MILTPSPEQQEAIDRMATEPTRAALLAPDTGVGKTLIAVEVAKALGAQTILIIAPLGTKGSVKKQDGWEYTFHRQGVDMPFLPITAATPENFDRLKNNEPGIYFVGREFFGISATSLRPKRKSDGTMTPGRIKRWSWGSVKPDLAVFDEVQTASNRDSVTYTVLKTLKAGYKIASSATPQGNKFSGLWSVCRWLWWDTRNPAVPYDPDAPYIGMYVDNSFWRWAAMWAQVETDPFVDLGEGRKGKKVLGEITPGAFVASLPCYISIEAVRTPVTVRRVVVDLTPKQRELYNQMESSALAWLDDHPLVADLPIVQRARMRQITLAEPTMILTDRLTDEGDPVYEVDFADDAESSKITALETIISKYHPTDPIFILTDSQKFARVVAHRLGDLAVEWSGKVNHAERDRIKSEFGKSIRYVVAVIPSVAEGLDGFQKVCHTEVWMSESLNGMLNEQVEGRLNRRGQEAKEIIRWKIQARGTDDDYHFQNLIAQRYASRATLRKKVE